MVIAQRYYYREPLTYDQAKPLLARVEAALSAGVPLDPMEWVQVN
jgi:hypothetical protein